MCQVIDNAPTSTIRRGKNGFGLPRIFGFTLFVSMMAAGYYYNLTFVQLGLEDLGTRHLGLTAEAVARDMAALALMTCVTAIGFGWWLQKQPIRSNFQIKLRISFGVVLLQAVLTLMSGWIRNEGVFLLWLSGVSFSLGIGVPVMFSMTVDLVPVRWRGAAAALVTALAYFGAETLSDEWTFEAFRRQSLTMLSGGIVGMGLLAWLRHPWLKILGQQHCLPAFSRGRFVGREGGARHLILLIAIMFGIYFVDSLGFLRLLKTPHYMTGAWQSADLDVRLFIAGVHVAGALVAGVLYSSMPIRPLFLWIFGIFALTHLQYSFHIRTGAETSVLSMPMLYALAVSLYTVVNFAIWADISTPDTISFNAAIGVALSGWTATFLSTGLAIYLGEHLSLERHIQLVDSLAFLFFIFLLVVLFFRRPPAQGETL